jgi:glutamyl-tRNA reductase
MQEGAWKLIDILATIEEVLPPVLVSLSANHRTTSFDALERLSAVGDGVGSRLRDAHAAIRGTVVLSTCNRFEAYFELDDAGPYPPVLPAMDSVMEELAAAAEVPFRDIRTSVDFRQGNGVAHHLFSVASGLESVAVGEDEIAGQVRRAYDRSRAEGLTTPGLESLFQRASEASRAVKNAARVGEAGRSLVRLALELASSRITDWSAAHVVLVGTGRFAAASVAALRARGAEHVVVHSVSADGRGERFAAQHDLGWVEAGGFAAELARADVVVTCTTTTGAYPVSAELLSRDVAKGYRLVIDLGMPRNVDPAVRGLPGVELLDLETIRTHAALDEFAEVDEARQIVASAAQRHAIARRVREVSPAVTAMRQTVQSVVDEEVARAQQRGDTEGERAARHLGGVLLHRLIGQAHRLAASGEGEAWTAAARLVFDLDDAAIRPE